ncbi:EF-hand domain-containing protein [Pseudoalteromonas shioyasakiensis]|uniref:EF-hand domain-containing protein n=1 Tax=Pseudoalteromonas shioyasakiensis TaxID=1190813 RepID=UPI002118AA1A|nr:EF-hand domain-containing protein [Pseudoalteromonas shioyasakiensis]MCQ8879009.1 EF-hand domain-containing protein [Pseudoalteromonas shioyasakiensis]
MNTFKHTLLFSLITISCSSFATSNRIAEQFKALDRNDDGLLTRSESAKDPALWSRFKNYDTDKDNRLSLAEFSVYLNQ